jgi:hypothetical protein
MRQYQDKQMNAVGGDDMFIGRVIVIVLMILSLPFTGMAISREFIENYTYSAGESDSKLTCRMVALIEIKRLLLEKIGTYLESRTEIKDFRMRLSPSRPVSLNWKSWTKNGMVKNTR